jgi:hypothetical protein
VAPNRSFGRDGNGPGFLGPKFAPLVVGGGNMGAGATLASGQGFAELKVDAIKPPAEITADRVERRLELWRVLEDGFLSTHSGAAPRAHRTVYDNSLQMIHSQAATAFDLAQEMPQVRERYGKGVFGQGCLLARRLVEQGVPFVEVSLTSSSAGSYGWDTHANNFEAVKALSAELDAGWASLLADLDERGLLERTQLE